MQIHDVIKQVQKNVQKKMEGESELNQKVEMIETAIDEEEEEEKEEEAADVSAHPEGTSSLNTERGIFFQYIFQRCFNCRPSDSTVSEDARIETRTTLG